jgi:hypothetical protein
MSNTKAYRRADEAHRCMRLATTSRQLALDADELAGVEVGGLEHVVHGLGMYAERPPDADGRQFAVVNQPVDRHLADPHQCCHFSDSQELRPGLLAVSGT